MPSGDVLPAVTGVKALVDSGLDKVPSNFIRPLSERANGNKVVAPGDKLHIPVIDLSKLDGPDRAATLDAIHQACKEWGFFQVVKHGVPSAWTNGVRNLAEDFFDLPVEERLTVWCTPLLAISPPAWSHFASTRRGGTGEIHLYTHFLLAGRMQLDPGRVLINQQPCISSVVAVF